MKLLKHLIIIIALKSSLAACMPGGVLTVDILLKMCHSCMLPLQISSVYIPGIMPDPMPSIPAPLCACADPIPRIGIPLSFFEPNRIVEVVSDPFCFPTIGIPTSPTFQGTLGGTKSLGTTSQNTFMQAHYMIFPIYAIAELVLDILCLETNGADIAYITEVDPLWNSDILAAFIQPDALLFGNPVSNLACVADSISSAVFLPLDPLFWCMGSWGNAYPMTGHKDTSASFIQDTAAIAAKMIYKLHRELIIWVGFGNQGLCGNYPLPIWRKGAFRLQPISPVPHPIATVIGQTGLLWDTLKDVPGTFDNFGFLLFKKRDCCVL